MESVWFVTSICACMVLAPANGAELELVPVKLTTLVEAVTAAGSSVVPVSLLPPAKPANALYYVSAMPTDTNGNSISGVVDLAKVLGQASTDLGYVWAAAGSNSGYVPISVGSLLGTSAAHGSPSAGIIGYGFPRGDAVESFSAVEGGGITAKSNIKAGGAVWEWWFQGKQFINDYDYGRQLSMAIYTEEGRALQETGDNYGGPNIPAYARHPSPTAYIRTSGAHQSSRAIPLDWSPDARGGGRNNPILYVNALMGKELTLNWKGPDGAERAWPVALYESVYEGPALSVAVVEAPTAYLTAEFKTYYKYDPKSDLLSAVSAYHNKVNISGGEPSGLIIASGPGPAAIGMGVYIADPNAGLVLYDNSGPDGGKYGSSFSKWSVIYHSGVTSSWRFRAWIVTDTVQKIQREFEQLYAWHVTSRDLKR